MSRVLLNCNQSDRLVYQNLALLKDSFSCTLLGDDAKISIGFTLKYTANVSAILKSRHIGRCCDVCLTT